MSGLAENKKSPGEALIREVVRDGVMGSKNYLALVEALPDYWETARIKRRGGLNSYNR